MAVNAQHLITLSIGKIAGSRTQRGGICLRKNLLVASVLSSARAYYYEEMCNRMQEHASDVEEEYDLSSTTNVPSEWDKEDIEISCKQQDTVTDAMPCDQTPPHQDASCEQCNANGVDKENEPEQSIELAELKSVDMESCVTVIETESSQQRQVLSDCTTFDQNTEKPSKRKRSEIEEACDSIIPKKARVECDIVTVSKPSSTKEHVKTESSISSLVSIFRSGLQGLSGEVNSPSVPSNHYPVSRSAFAQAPISIAAC